jgi:hypothetical protein
LSAPRVFSGAKTPRDKIPAKIAKSPLRKPQLFKLLEFSDGVLFFMVYFLQILVETHHEAVLC